MTQAELPTARVQVPESVPGAGIGMRARLRYWRRVFSAYGGGRTSHLTFWHGTPEVNSAALPGEVDQYWQRFAVKADYPGPKDARGIPMLDYHGHVGLQYNPIAIAQYGLGNYNRFRREADPERRARFLAVADWLVENLEPNAAGVPVWNHRFDWEYRTPLKNPWYSCLSQGQGISLLVRAHRETGESGYLTAARDAFISFTRRMDEGGVQDVGPDGHIWFEETVVKPPTHILNGFMWASWGLYDLWLYDEHQEAGRLWQAAVDTLLEHLGDFDIGYWSLYDQAGTPVRNAASAFYHALHVVQLRIMARLTDNGRFTEWAERWDAYRRSAFKRRRAWAHKALFKLLYY
ncbi:MAG: D-glucuronyl C5-epimerase family protein [Gemmatimonadota bacterium]